ncbi:MAG: hypothetical protein DWC07_01275 [Candidatus Poseidoniales archaeon]|nr:MAG: hypothetical protein DWC07_01275 [Candidatus Poseidoniales archaeon]
MILMTAWSIGLSVSGHSEQDAKALASSLSTECDVVWRSPTSFELVVNEANCKDLRAMWNTRLRGLIATDNVLKVLGKHS